MCTLMMGNLHAVLRTGILLSKMGEISFLKILQNYNLAPVQKLTYINTAINVYEGFSALKVLGLWESITYCTIPTNPP